MTFAAIGRHQASRTITTNTDKNTRATRHAPRDARPPGHAATVLKRMSILSPARPALSMTQPEPSSIQKRVTNRVTNSAILRSSQRNLEPFTRP